jgi:hypothetical protein
MIQFFRVNRNIRLNRYYARSAGLPTGFYDIVSKMIGMVSGQPTVVGYVVAHNDKYVRTRLAFKGERIKIGGPYDDWPPRMG